MEITSKRFMIINSHPISIPPLSSTHIQQLPWLLATMAGQEKRRKTLLEREKKKKKTYKK
jgi:hypothetical protein